MPDAKTMGRWGVAVGPQVLRQLHERMIKIAQDNGIVSGTRMRVDTTVVESNVHYPTDSTLLGDGVRVLTRTMKKITGIVGEVGTKLRDRSRCVKLRVIEIMRIARAKGPLNRDRLQQRYRRLLDATSRIVGQAKRFFRGDTRVEGKIVSVFEPSTEVILKGKAGKTNEFGKMVKLQEAENQIITEYEVYSRRPHDSELLVPAIEIHQAALGRVPHLIAADAAFYSLRNEATAKA